MYTYNVYIMVRTQVYLSQAEKRRLEQISKESGKSQSVLIREAVDRLIHSYSHHSADRKSRLAAAFGIWKDRPLKELRAMRAELDRV
ncbi:MAG: ribbon-helix-helix protein, CopG family [Leptospiraceae bacterium]|nr:ribbon-helix-helix protein, CopG family [Leptospiraceae bacterium]MCB1321686.1 ribbon-helix-helix protein, CopG family [Leptospiraceae bacterium]